jgi:hypothetical protein
MRVAGWLYGLGHGLSDWLDDALADRGPSWLAETDWHAYVAGWVSRPLFWLGWWIDVQY